MEIKRLIFDLDNTLIEWKEEYELAIKKVVEEYNLPISYKEINRLIDEYEQYYNVYKKEYFLELIKLKLNISLEVDFMDKWFAELSNMADYDQDLVDTLEYLSSKYELVILTNWFLEPQLNRLKKTKIDKYFKEVYSGEDVIKPNIESFKKAIGNNVVKQCVMIGDNYNIDIEVPLSIGMKVIRVDLNNRLTKKNYPVIKNIKELKEMF